MQRVLLSCSGKNEIHRLLKEYVQAVYVIEYVYLCSYSEDVRCS